MKDIRYGFANHVVPLLGPIDKAATATNTAFVDLKNAVGVRFFVFCGVLTATSADQNLIITLEAATAAVSGSEVQIAGTYKLSGAVGTDSWGTATAFTGSGGVSLDTTSADNKMVAMDVDLHALDAALADARFMRIVITPDAGATVSLVAAWAEIEPTYPQTSLQSTS